MKEKEQTMWVYCPVERIRPRYGNLLAFVFYYTHSLIVITDVPKNTSKDDVKKFLNEIGIQCKEYELFCIDDAPKPVIDGLRRGYGKYVKFERRF